MEAALFLKWLESMLCSEKTVRRAYASLVVVKSVPSQAATYTEA
jgi:hypothetical protein